jgi:hypothetical protein
MIAARFVYFRGHKPAITAYANPNKSKPNLIVAQMEAISGQREMSWLSKE